ncbi:MAG: hypothetical protein K8I02_13055 [Candidatus Methylomirabilis sp.]|nr:hypothetical protein [Deltaproteobacteria bacterium]
MVKSARTSKAKPARPPKRNEAALRLLEAWMRDESGYDERVWPEAARGLEENRKVVGARPLFSR